MDSGLRELTPRRWELVQAIVGTARDEVEAMGRTMTDTVAERLGKTLDAALWTRPLPSSCAAAD
jgi:hypothetical protein